MFLKIYKKIFFSKSTFFILLFLTAVSIISFYFLREERQLFIEQIGDLSPDLNQEALVHLIENNTGFQFLVNYWFNSGFYSLTLIILYAWCGAFLSPRLQVEKENGFGNLIMIRKKYKTYLRQLFLSQSIYIFTIIFLKTVISLIFAIIFGGLPTNNSIVTLGTYELTIFQTTIIIGLQILWISLICILINGITLVTNVWIENKYLIQVFPLLTFVFLPYLLGTAVGNIIPSIGRLIRYIFPESLSTMISLAFNSDFQPILLLQSIFPIVILIFTFIILYSINSKKNMRDYL